MHPLIRLLGIKTAEMCSRKANLKLTKDTDRAHGNRILYNKPRSNRQYPHEYGRKLHNRPKPPAITEPESELTEDAG